MSHAPVKISEKMLSILYVDLWSCCMAGLSSISSISLNLPIAIGLPIGEHRRRDLLSFGHSDRDLW